MSDAPDLAELQRLLEAATPAPNGCLLWPRGRLASGYGAIYVGGRHTSAHRHVLSLAIGRPLTSQEFACHHCDNPPCINPEHLFVGSPRDNVRDMMAKGRGNFAKSDAHRAAASQAINRALAEGRLTPLRGEACSTSKLNAEAVSEIRTSKLSQRRLAKQFGVSQRLVSLVRSGKSWPHIPLPPPPAQPVTGEVGG